MLAQIVGNTIQICGQMGLNEVKFVETEKSCPYLLYEKRNPNLGQTVKSNK